VKGRPESGRANKIGTPARGSKVIEVLRTRADWGERRGWCRILSLPPLTGSEWTFVATPPFPGALEAGNHRALDSPHEAASEEPNAPALDDERALERALRSRAPEARGLEDELVPPFAEVVRRTRGAESPAGSADAPRVERDRLMALVDLLADESPAIYRVVREELLAADRLADAPLARAAAGEDARIRGRARQILALRERQGVRRRLLGFARKDEIDLERALFLLGRLDRPDLDTRPYERALDAMAEEVARRAAREHDAFSRPMVLSQYLGNELGFVGSEADFAHPDNIHLHRAIERKRGMPLTLTAVYLFVARRARIQAAPVALPGRVLLRLYAGKRSMLIDPFQGGRARTRMDCIRYLAQHGLVPRPEWFHDATDRQLFQRHVLNLMSSSQVRGLHREAQDLHRLAVEIGRRDPR